MPLWLSESDVRAVLTMGELIDAMESALIAFSAGRVVQPVRTVMEIAERCFFALMPALDSEGSVLGTKLVTVLPGNTAKGLPSHQAAIVLFDPASGALVAVTDGRYITEARTAAVSAVSVRHMADERKEVEGEESVFNITINAYFIVVLKMATIKYLQHNLQILSGEPMFSKTMLTHLAKCGNDSKDELAIIVGAVLIPIMNMESFLYGITVQKKTLDQTLSNIREKREKKGRGIKEV